ncbi:hypothetical protein ACFFLZ_17220 [Photobacterium aphoticum]|uniref:PLD phosphodiesterase domain-containing protein n=1 Tax=Photobacterium aphoticum TaxID=754436 RepID=A0A0J1GMH7_9GAMM|nr:hypothetical protein [Photobacterium aphoticum]KLV00958.1 hypothetical protein ABT58_10425 [Photobacterium aphoticum]PSU58870.1 hypothetical protein C9I90_05060 [Photobacterium aphoticum]GHA58311.1 hypothetical protein GCM10007086_35300 [Photobacterium aphoticum]
MTKSFKLAEELAKQLQSLGHIKHAWFTTFNLNMDFFERHVLSTLLQMDKPRSRIDFELMQQKLNGSIKEGRKGNANITANMDVKVFADQRMYDASDLKRTAIEVYGVNPALLDGGRKKVLNNSTLFHPKVIFLQDEEGKAILGAGSANLTLSGWSTNQEVFTFQCIECQHQVEAIRAFFKPLFEANQVETKISFPRNLRSEITPSDWCFVHTFIKNSSDGKHKTLLSHLLGHSDEAARDLVVWSPYFPSDLAGFIQRLKSVALPHQLKLHLVPDLVENQRMRTQWSEDLLPLLSDESVRFYRSPIAKDERSELCHAKVWMTNDKLAIGSWNFTTPGSNLDVDSKGAGPVNIEAGIILANQQSIKTVLTQSLSITEDNFMQSKELSQHALEVAELMPVETRVVFDWQTLTYHIELLKIDDDLAWQSVELHLPDLDAPLHVVQAASETVYATTHKLPQEPQALLVNHAYELVLTNGLRYRGFIVEHNSMMRRVEEFESLDDIFNSLIEGRSLESNPNASLRSAILGNDHDWLDEQEAGSLSEPHPSPTLSYFRMFQAMDSFEQRIQTLKSDRMIEQYAFVVPGCLLEMGLKIRHELTENANVFNWYMKQEFNLLVDQVKKNANDPDLKARLSDLRFKSKDSVIRAKELQNSIGSGQYRSLIKGKCNYVSI